MIVTPNFHFGGDCCEAIDLYKKVFHIKVLCMYKEKDADPLDFLADVRSLEKVYHAEVMLGNTRLMMSDGRRSKNILEHPMSLVVTYDTKEEVLNAFDMLKDGARIIQPIQTTTYSSCFVSLEDRFGMRWELMTEQTER